GAAVRVVTDADRGAGAYPLDDALGSAGEAGRAGGVDALVTTSPEVVLAILTADCVPIVLHDPVAGVLACVHAGWRGTVAGVTAAALAAMQGLGTRPADVTAGIGPAIGADRYQVGPDVHEAVTRSFGPAAAKFIRPDPRWHTEQARAAARLVFLLSGGSYYKTAAPPVIDLGATALTQAEAALLRDFYRQGLAEFAYRNSLDITSLSLEARRIADQP